MSSNKCHVISFGNQKGGVSKTTNSVNVAAGLGRGGKKVLLIDLDPASGATDHLGVDTESVEGSYEMLLHTLKGYDTDAKNFTIENDMPKNVHLIPSRPYLENMKIVFGEFDDPKVIVRDAIEKFKFKEKYDFIIIDTPPQPSSVFTTAAYIASDWVVLCVLPEPLSVVGMIRGIDVVGQVRKKLNPNLSLLGVAISRVDNRTKIWVEEVYKPLYAAKLDRYIFNSRMRLSVLVTRAQKAGRSVFDYNDSLKRKVEDSGILNDYRDLVKEIITRVENSADFLSGKFRTFTYEDELKKPKQIDRMMASMDEESQETL